MIKECDIILHNNKVAVVLFDGRKIQIPHNKLIKDKVYIEFKNERYSVASKEDFDKQSSNSKIKTKKSSNEIIELESTEKVDVNSELY